MKLKPVSDSRSVLVHWMGIVDTNSADRTTFREAIEQGELVTFTASVNAVGARRWRSACA